MRMQSHTLIQYTIQLYHRTFRMQASSCLKMRQHTVLRGHLVPQVPAMLAVGSTTAPRQPTPPTAASHEPRCTVEGWRRPLSGGTCALGATLPPVVALGKFDALHKGHQALVIAAAHLGGSPWLVSFSGMAEVLGWPRRLPLTPAIDRERVLRSWTAACGGYTPRECAIPFSEVRSMAPEAFVYLLAVDLRVAGVVVGSNYRFGYKATGTAALLQQLGPQHGMKVEVLDLVECSQDDTVSSSRVRAGLASGDMEQVEDCLGRPYRLAVSLQGACLTEGPRGQGVRLGLEAFLNQPPGNGEYTVDASWCPPGGSTLDCEGQGCQEARLNIDDTGLTVAGGAGVAGLGQQGEGVLVLDFRSNGSPEGRVA